MTAQPLTRLGEDPASPFPPTSRALAQPNGLLAWGGGLEPGRLLNAYRQGIFPWYVEGQPILWWSPAPRCVLRPADVYVSKRTRRRFNTGRLRVSADTDFGRVMRCCATRGRDSREPADTWITGAMIDGYTALHQAGYAHSVEVRNGNELVGGIYGIALGRVFFGESMFSTRTDASKFALIALCRQLERWAFAIIDCQIGNAHLYRMGARDMARERFEHMLRQYASPGLDDRPGSWRRSFSCDERW